MNNKLFRFKKLKQPVKHPRLHQVLQDILEEIESVSGDFDLNKIYRLLGKHLQDFNINLIILMLDSSRRYFNLRYYKLAEKSAEKQIRGGTSNIEDQRVPLNQAPLAQKAIENNQTLWVPERQKSLIGKFEELDSYLDKIDRRAKLNSIIVPISIQGETIGTIEFAAAKIKENHLQIFKDFCSDLVNQISKMMLYQEVKRSEGKYRNLVNNAADGVAIISTQGRITFANESLCRISGYPYHELINMHFKNLLYHEDKDLVSRRFNSRISGKNTVNNYSFRILTKDKKIRHLSYSGSLIKEFGHTIGIQAMVRDITENKKLEEKIVESKNRYEQIIDTIDDSLCVIDKKNVITSCNRAFADNVNLPMSGIIGNKCHRVLPRFGRGLFANHCQRQNKCKACEVDQTFKTGKINSYIEKNQDQNGFYHYHTLSIFPAKNKKGDIYQVVMTIRNITEQKRAEERIRRLSEFNQRIIDTAPISIIVIDKQGLIMSANRLARSLMGRPEKDLCGLDLTQTKEIRKDPILAENYKVLLRNGEAFFYEGLNYTAREKPGEKRYLNLIAVPLFDLNQNVEGAISMAIDNTDAIQAKNKLEELNRDLELKVLKRTKDLDKINKQLSQAINLKSKFIADASHELRTPLTVIQGNLDLAIREAQNKNCDPPESFNYLLNEVGRMTRILSDLTMLTNADSGSEQLMNEEVDLAQMVRSISQSLRVLADQKKIKLVYKKNLNPVKILGDEAKLEKMLMNIVRNAIKYTESKGRIEISLGKEDGKAVIKVADNGIGIPEEDMPYIFERFYRVDKARSREEGGTGLGLSICKWIAEMHNGEIKVESEVGKGSTFIVELPINKNNDY